MDTPSRPASKTSPARDWARALDATAAIARDPHLTLFDLVEAEASRDPGCPALIGEESDVRYGELAALMRRYARLPASAGIEPGARVALLMPNAPAYLAIWLGLTRAGVVVALINTELVGASLAHALGVADSGHVIVDPSLEEALAGALAAMESRPIVWVIGGETAPPVADLSDAPLAAGEVPAPRTGDTALLIYTSGTTGLPKAARISHGRVLEWSLWFAGLLETGPEDRMYLCLPMYHSVGGVVATGALLARGGSVVIRRRFSASRFWRDIGESGATLFQYIGELCRYVVNAPVPADAPRHRLRLCVGNGLSRAVWPGFAAATGGARILEFYASTEGNLSLYNCEGEIGALGRVPPLLAGRFPLALVRVDPESGEPVRGPDGLCIASAPDEPGEALGLIAPAAGHGGRPFDGYTSQAETARKVLADVREPGDRWFRTGDLMRRDPRGFVFFVDRLGETFRWKGENVATSEVAEALRAVPGIADAAVYGVALPGHEGRAGMAALALGSDTDPERLLAGLPGMLAAALPAYARPLFLRLDLPLTGTLKHAVGRLKEEGYDPARRDVPVFAYDRDCVGYVPVDRGILERIADGDWPA